MLGLSIPIVCVMWGGLAGQTGRIIPRPTSWPVEMLPPEFGSEGTTTFQTPIVSVGHTEESGTPRNTQTAIPIEPIPESIDALPLETMIPEDSPPVYAHGPMVSMDPELAPYMGRAELIDDQPLVPIALPPLPEGFQPWWMKQMDQPLRRASHPLPVNLEWLTFRALDHSPQVLAMNLDPSIRQTEIWEEQAAFDWRAFVDSAFDSNSDPVGNTLTTGGSPRFRDRIWGHTMGFRRRTTIGGEVEASQRIGYQNNNSRFFVPTQQGTSILTLSFTQPLLARSGRAYNTSRIAMAYLDTGIAEDDLVKGLQDHLVKVAESYWELYRARALLQQKSKLLARAEFVLEMLEARENVDAQARQILRARAAVASRRSEIARAAMSIRNAESQLRLLVNDPELTQGSSLELLPQESPLAIPLNITMGDSLVTAIQNRPEISKALKTVRNTSLRTGMAESEFKPALDLVLGTYVSGLNGNSDIPQSFLNQFNQGEPGWSVGLLFNMPLGRRAARARLNQRQLEMQQAMLDFRTSVEMTLTEVEIAVREVRTTYQEMLSTYQAMHATETEAEFLYERWRLLVGGDRSTTLLLEDLLDAQERVADEEANFVSAQVGYVLALANLKRAMGVLLMMDDPAEFRPSPNPATVESFPEPAPAPDEEANLTPEPQPVEQPRLIPAPMPTDEPPLPNYPELPPLPIPVAPGHTRPIPKKTQTPGHSSPKPIITPRPRFVPPLPKP